jgi:TonB family protein
MLKKSLNILLLVIGFSFITVSAQTIKSISKGVVNSSAISLPNPVYPPAALAVRAGGAVNVQVTIDEKGNVIIANAVSGHEFLREASEQAAMQAKFSPTFVEGNPVKVRGVIVFNFIP